MAALPYMELSYPEWWRDWPQEATATVPVRGPVLTPADENPGDGMAVY